MANQNRDQENDDQAAKVQDQPAGERRRDDARGSHGPTYHGGDWSKADAEDGREAIDLPAEEEVRNDVERADEEIDDPGTRGAVFGKGGRGLVERDLSEHAGAKKS